MSISIKMETLKITYLKSRCGTQASPQAKLMFKFLRLHCLVMKEKIQMIYYDIHM